MVNHKEYNNGDIIAFGHHIFIFIQVVVAYIKTNV